MGSEPAGCHLACCASERNRAWLEVVEGFEKIEKQRADLGEEVNGWHVNDFTLNRAAYGGNWLRRAAVAMAGIYANDTVETFYPLLATDSDGKKPDASTSRYTLTFPAGSRARQRPCAKRVCCAPEPTAGPILAPPQRTDRDSSEGVGPLSEGSTAPPRIGEGAVLRLLATNRPGAAPRSTPAGPPGPPG